MRKANNRHYNHHFSWLLCFLRLLFGPSVRSVHIGVWGLHGFNWSGHDMPINMGRVALDPYTCFTL